MGFYESNNTGVFGRGGRGSHYPMRGIDERISRLLKALQSDQEKLTVFDGEKMHQVQLRDICYFEAVDNRVFAYLDTKVFEIHSVV